MSTWNANFASSPTSGSVGDPSFSRILAWPSKSEDKKFYFFYMHPKLTQMFEKLSSWAILFFCPLWQTYRFTQFKEGQRQPTGNSICLRGEVIKQTLGVSIILARQYCSNTQIGLHRSIQSSLTWKAGYVLQQTVKVFYYFVCSSHIYVALQISSAFW